MTLIVFPHSTPVFAEEESGGKGFNLYRASRLGFAVPAWATIGRSVFLAFVRQSNIETSIESTITTLDAGEISAAEAAASIGELFANSTATPELTSAIREAYNYIGYNKMLAIRSSSADEDSLRHSFAGQLSSFLYVSEIDDAIKFTKDCFASAFSERCLAYRKENGLLKRPIEVAVVLQEMIDADISGVLFTCNPVSLAADQYLISALYGAGEGLVSGALDADNYWLDSNNGALKTSEIKEKSHAFTRLDSGKLKQVAVEKNRSTAAALNETQLSALFELGKSIAQTFGRPQDIEWVIKDDTLYLIQTRPVSSLNRDLTGFPNLWDNSNIVESYGGLTSPLSFTFALNNYRLVYQQFCEVLGIPHHIVKDMDHYLRNMLGCINGRVYYNLYNWYKLVGILPGFANNREFMETMMGVQEQLSDEITDRISPHPSWNTFSGRVRRWRVGLSFLYYHFKIQKVVDQFLAQFRQSYDVYRAKDYSLMPGDKIFQHYLQMERDMIGDWKAPIINDFLCMVHFGLLKKLTSLWLTGADANIQNDLLSGEGNLESAAPTVELLRLAREAKKEPELAELIQKTPASLLLETLNQSIYQDFFKQIQGYIQQFGYRCMNEMKLEEKDLFSDPSYLFTCLKNYIGSPGFDSHSVEGRETEIRASAEKRVRESLSGLKLKIHTWVLHHARKSVRNRENTRFARTRAYGIARIMFRAIGKDLAGLDIINASDDVFYLKLEEVYGIYQGTLAGHSLKEIVQLRRDQYEQYEDKDPDPRFLTRGAVYWNNMFVAPPSADPVHAGEYDLIGIPCCPGIVEGVVKIVTSANEDLELNGQILVTLRTDPGWVPLYPSVSALLVERGSLLSHSAIVAREMGLPAIVGIEGLLRKLKSGMRIRMDGAKGTIEILSDS